MRYDDDDNNDDDFENDSSDYENDANSVFVAVILAYQNNAKCFVFAYSCFHRVCPSKG